MWARMVLCGVREGMNNVVLEIVKEVKWSFVYDFTEGAERGIKFYKPEKHFT